MERLEQRLALSAPNPIAGAPYVFPAGRLFHENAGDIAAAIVANQNGSTQAMLCRLANEGEQTAETGLSLADIRQGNVNDCGLLASLAEEIIRAPQMVERMIEQLADGTYDVTFSIPFHNTPYVVNVTADLPASSGQLFYNGIGLSTVSTDTVLWACYVEKAYADFVAPTNPSYDNTGGWFPSEVWERIGANPTTFDNWTMNESDFAAQWNAGQLLCFVTPVSEPNPNIVPNHVYAVESYDAGAGTVTLFNPYGPGWEVTLTWPQIQTDTEFWDTGTPAP
jgi:hypothetical protein